MPLLSLVRLLMTLLSLAILATAAYLAWRWYDGDFIRQANGELVRVRANWHLWLALALGAFSVFGRIPILPLLAAPDRGEPSREDRGAGQIIPGPSGSSLFVEAIGEGPMLVLTHGWAMDSTIWHYAKRALATRFRLIVWDLPGLGRSKGPVALENFAACLQAVVDWSGADRVVLVGHSIGGMTIQTLARDNPVFFAERIAGVVLLNTTYTNPLKTSIVPRLMQAMRWPLLEPGMRLTMMLQPLVWLSAWQSYLSGTAHLANRLGFGKYVTRSQLNHVTLLSTKNPPGEIARGNLAMFGWDATGAFSGSRVPVLLLAGHGDILTKPEASKAIAAQPLAATVRVIEGVNHMGMLERADEYNSAIADFAGRILGSPLGPSPKGARPM